MGLDRQVGDILCGRAEDCGHSGFVEVTSVTKEVRGRLDCEVAAPLECPDGVAAATGAYPASKRTTRPGGCPRQATARKTNTKRCRPWGSSAATRRGR